MKIWKDFKKEKPKYFIKFEDDDEEDGDTDDDEEDW